MMAPMIDDIVYADYSGRETERLYSLFRHLNKMLAGRRPDRSAQPVLSTRAKHLDPERMGPEARYLMKHILVLQGRYEDRLAEVPHWRILENVPSVPPHSKTLVLSERPTGAHPYFKTVGIVL